MKTKMQIWSCYMKTLYLQKISCTRQIESKLSLLSFALFLQKNINSTNSVLEEESKEMSDEAYTEAMFDKFYGAWKGDESADELMGNIKENT